ncbi:hypothetical protein TURU_123738 [Turdus rufiventris]|nr:hypothetical protein TURU_123738 [Turdus rufiventris]
MPRPSRVQDGLPSLVSNVDKMRGSCFQTECTVRSGMAAGDDKLQRCSTERVQAKISYGAHAVGVEHRTLDCEVGTTGWEAWHKDKYDRFRESLRLEKISKTIEFNLQPNTTISTEPQH